MGITIHDYRQHKPAHRQDYRPPAGIGMVALCNFSNRSLGMVRRGARFSDPVHRKHRIDKKQACDDFTALEGAGFDVGDCHTLGRAGILTVNQLADIEPSRIPDPLRQAVLRWRSAVEETKTAAPGEALLVVPGVGKKSAAVLAGAGVTTLDLLRALPAQALEDMELSPATVEAIETWRATDE